MNIKQKISGAIVTGAMMAATVAPAAFASADVTISGNGFGSTNGVLVIDANATIVEQENVTIVETFAIATSSTGGNSSSFNLGGGNTINTGDADSSVRVNVEGSTNTASLPDCGCDDDPVVVIKNNGALSHNGVAVIDLNLKKTTQSNLTAVGTFAMVKSNTGKNKSSFNLGGAKKIKTGNSTSRVTVNVGGSTNNL